MSLPRKLTPQTGHADAYCSFCREPRSKTGPIIEGPDAGGMSISICRTCAELAVEVIDEEERRRRGENPAGLKRSTVEMIEVCITTLNHFESLSRKREFTEAELKIKQWIESELERLSDGT